MAVQLNQRAEAVAHIRFAGRSFDIPLSTLDLRGSGGQWDRMSEDGQLKTAIARYLEVPAGRLEDYVIDRHANGNLTLRPEAVFG